MRIFRPLHLFTKIHSHSSFLQRKRFFNQKKPLENEERKEIMEEMTSLNKEISSLRNDNAFWFIMAFYLFIIWSIDKE